MARLTVHIGAKVDDLKRGLAGARTRINRFAKKSSRVIANGIKLGAAGLAAGLAVAFRGAIKSAAAFEQTKLAFRVMIGDAKIATQLVDRLNDISKNSSFLPDSVIDAGKKLLGFGFAAREVADEVKTLGDISSGTGKDLTELAAIYGKAFAKGKVDMEIINQLSEAGVPILQTLAKQYGVTTGELIKMVSEGKVKFADLKKAMEAMTSEGGQFFNMMQEQSKTLNGTLSTLEGSLKDLARGFGETLLPELKAITGEAMNLANAFLEIGQARNQTKDAGGDVEVNKTTLGDRLKAGMLRYGELASDYLPMPTFIKKRMKQGIENVDAELMAGATTELSIAAPTAEEKAAAKQAAERARGEKEAESLEKDVLAVADAMKGLDFDVAADMGDVQLEAEQAMGKALKDGAVAAAEQDVKKASATVAGLRDQAAKLAGSINGPAGGGIAASALTRIGGERGRIIDPQIKGAQKQFLELQKLNAKIEAAEGIQKDALAALEEIRDKIDPEVRFP